MPPFYRVTIFLTGSRAFSPSRVLGTIQRIHDLSAGVNLCPFRASTAVMRVNALI